MEDSNQNFKRVFASSSTKGTEVFSSTVVSIYEILPRAHQHSSKHEEKIPRFTVFLDRMEKERLEEIFVNHEDARMAVIPNPINSSIVRIEINSMTSHNLFRETVLDLYSDGRVCEVHRLEHSQEKQFHKKNVEISSREYYYVVKLINSSSKE